MRENLKLLLHIFRNPQKYSIEMPITHYVNRTPDFQAFGDACLNGAGGYSDELGFWFFIPWPEEIKNRTLNMVKSR